MGCFLATGDRVAGELSFGHHRLKSRLRDRIDASGRGEFYHVSGWVVVGVLDAGHIAALKPVARIATIASVLAEVEAL